MNHKLNISGAKYSAIVSIGKELKKRSLAENRKFLYLNRGINQVVNIDLESVVKDFDFNSKEMQYYPAGKGKKELREAINQHFFNRKANTENIFITSGGMYALRLSLETLSGTKVYTPNLFWGAYSNLLKISNKEQAFYKSYSELIEQSEKFKDAIVIICDPNNPTGEKAPDELLIKVVEALQKQNTTVIWDGPYRKLFTAQSDRMYENLEGYDNVIITESFSKSVGLSGQRIGFVHCVDKNFQKEFAVRLLFSGNGVNVFAQILIEKLLSKEAGLKAVEDFRKETSGAIRKNISFLKENNLLAKELYSYNEIYGIFVIVNKTVSELAEAGIGSVGLNYFTKDKSINTDKYSRLCVSVSHKEFKEFFERIL